MEGRYSTDKKIGGGSFGEVFLGKLNVAIKRIQKKLIQEENLYEELEREKNLLIKLQSQNVVKLIDFVETKDYYDIILEQCDTDLKTILNNKKEGYTIPEIRNIMNQLNNAFKVMTANNIIHRDIKLENILVKYLDSNKDKMLIKLGDFGLSRQFFGMSYIDSTFCGTPETMAPEIKLELPYNNKVDLYSIGMVMYELYYKKFPKFNKFHIPNELPEDENFKDILEKLLRESPNERLSWKEYFIHPFFLDMKHINIIVMGKKNIGKSTLIKSILKENIEIDDMYNYSIYESKDERFRFFEIRGFLDNENEDYTFENCMDDVNRLVDFQLETKEPDNYIHIIWYCLQEDKFTHEEQKNLDSFKDYYSNDKLPICLIHTMTINRTTIGRFFNRIIRKNDDVVITKILAEKFEVKNGKEESTFSPFGVDYLLKRTLGKLKDIVKNDENESYLPLQNERRKHKESFQSIIEQVQNLLVK